MLTWFGAALYLIGATGLIIGLCQAAKRGDRD